MTPICFVRAQPPSHSIQHPGDKKLTLPDFSEEKPTTELSLPPIKPAAENEKLSAQLRILVKKIHLEGNTVFSNEELGKITASYIDRVISAAELQQLRHSLTLYYINRGYINSGVIIPDQQITNNEITLQVIEGELTDIQVSGNTRLRRDYISNRITLNKTPVLNVNDLQKHLQLIKQNPLIKRINAELGPGSVPGQSILRVKIEENIPYQVAATLNNHNSPSVGSERLQLEGFHRNFSGHGDNLTARIGVTEGLDDVSLSYLLPLNARDTTLNIRYEESDSAVIEEPFNAIDIESNSRSFGITLRQPIRKTTEEEFAIAVTLERRRSKTFLLGMPFSFSPGTDGGKSDVTALRLSHEWLQRTRKQVLAARSQFSLGINALGATVNTNAPDGRFVTWLGQFQWVQRTGDQDNQFMLGANIQLAGQGLLPLEKFSVGGVNSVRGYRENQLVRDNGIITTIEYRQPILNSGWTGSRLQFAQFIDAGLSWNNSEYSRRQGIASVGVGLLWDYGKKLHAELYLAKGFNDFTNEEHNLQDSGIHFQLRYNFF